MPILRIKCVFFFTIAWRVLRFRMDYVPPDKGDPPSCYEMSLRASELTGAFEHYHNISGL